MECDSEFRRLASRNRFIEDLERQGYEVDFVGNHLVIYGLPYLDNKGELRFGDLASPVDLKSEYEIDVPSTHQVWFNGEVPYGVEGRPLPISAIINRRDITPDLRCLLSFSFKIKNETNQMRSYESFEEKVLTYLDVLTTPARQKFGAIPQRKIETKAAQVQSPLRYPDTMSARDGVNELAWAVLGTKVAIIGLGGTGAYILDFLSKTHLELIRLFDDDIVHVHTLFRMPGALGKAALGKKKVTVLYNVYSDFHAAVEPNAEKIGAGNVDRLFDLDFVFIAVDDGPSRNLISRALQERGIPFIDVGMGLYRAQNGLNGIVRIAGGEVADASKLIGTEYLPSSNPADNEYRRQPQIGELNALNAALAVIRFKQLFGIFERDFESSANLFEICSFDLDHWVAKNEIPN